MTKIKIITYILAFSFLPSVVYAEQKYFDFAKPWYWGATIARSEVGLLSGQSVNGDVTQRFSNDDSGIGYAVFIGSEYASWYDLELRYQSLGTFEEDLRYSDAAQQIVVDVDSDLEYTGLSALFRPKYQLSRSFEVQADLGLVYLSADRSPKANVSGTQDPNQIAQIENSIQKQLSGGNDAEIGLTYGVNLHFRYKGNRAWSWRYFIQRFEHGDEELSLMGLGVSHHID